ncbi:MAG: hypothetical protein J6B81_00260 [Spirochaetaceae bacterium]|nr:hypothetical protein [Spirochaetaceae bacterium]
MNNVLSGIERDIVVSYLCDGQVPFTLVPEQPAERLFSLTTGTSGIRVLPEGIIVFTDSLVIPTEVVGSQVEIRFYFRKLGLSFSSKVNRTKLGALAIVIPKEILRLPDSTSQTETPFSCKLFLGEAFSGDCIDCTKEEDFPLFLPHTWRFLPENTTLEQEKILKKLCNAQKIQLDASVIEILCKTGKAVAIKDGKLDTNFVLPFDGYVTKQETGNIDFSKLEDGFYFVSGGNSSVTGSPFLIKGIPDAKKIIHYLTMIPICMFCTQNTATKEITALQDRVSPLSVLYISDNNIILAMKTGIFPLQTEIPYSLLLQIPLRSMRRSITLTCSIESITKAKEGQVCALCKLSNLKAEDQRFLFETLNGKLFC